MFFFQSSDSRGSDSSHSFSPERGGRGRKGRKTRGSTDSEESDVADMNTKTKKSAQGKKSQEEPKKGTYMWNHVCYKNAWSRISQIFVVLEAEFVFFLFWNQGALLKESEAAMFYCCYIYFQWNRAGKRPADKIG